MFCPTFFYEKRSDSLYYYGYKILNLELNILDVGKILAKIFVRHPDLFLWNIINEMIHTQNRYAHYLSKF